MKTAKAWLDYLYEGLFLFVIMEVLYVITYHLVPVVPLLLVAFINGTAFVLFEKKKVIPVPVILLVILLSVIVSYMTGLNPYVSLIWALVIGWRAYMHFVKKDIDLENQHALFLISLMLCLFVYFPLTENDQNRILIVLPIIQFFYLIFLKIFDMLISQYSSADASTRKYVVWGMGTFGLSVVVSVLAIVFSPVIKAVVTTIITWVGAVFGYIITNPIVWFLDALIQEDDEFEGEKGGPFEPLVKEKQVAEPTQQASTLFDNDLLILAVIAAVVTLLAIYVYKRKIRLEIDKISPVIINKKVTKSSAKRRFQRIKPPKDTVRKRFYQLQKSFAKKGLGRGRHESVEDWFSRIDLDTPDKAAIASDYRKVRYGGQQLSKSEMERYEKGIKDMIDKAKEFRKGKKG